MDNFKKNQSKTFEVQKIQTDKYKNSGGFELGPFTSHIIETDPKHLVFSLSRYKFVSKIFEKKNRICEIGCGDAFGSMITAKGKEIYYGVDVELFIIENNKSRLAIPNMEFVCKDILSDPLRPKY